MPCGLTAERSGAVTPVFQIANALGFVLDALRADSETEWSCHSLSFNTPEVKNEILFYLLSLNNFETLE
jgi:hypothetical protein